MSSLKGFEKIAQKALLYVLEGVAVAIVIYLLSKRTLSIRKTVSLAIIITSTIILLDVCAPEVLGGTRQGYGFGTGWNLVGGSKEGFDAGNAPPKQYTVYDNPFAGCPLDIKNLMNELSPKVNADNYIDWASA